MLEPQTEFAFLAKAKSLKFIILIMKFQYITQTKDLQSWLERPNVSSLMFYSFGSEQNDNLQYKFPKGA